MLVCVNHTSISSTQYYKLLAGMTLLTARTLAERPSAKAIAYIREYVLEFRVSDEFMIKNAIAQCGASAMFNVSHFSWYRYSVNVYYHLHRNI